MPRDPSDPASDEFHIVSAYVPKKTDRSASGPAAKDAKKRPSISIRIALIVGFSAIVHAISDRPPSCDAPGTV